VKFMKEEWVNPDDLYDWSVDGAPMHWEYDQTVDNGDGTFGNLVLVSPTVTYSNIGEGGSDTNGDTIYTNACLSCHGADGRTIDLGGRSVGQFAREKPNELWLKVKFGEPGKMDAGLVTTTSDILDLYKALTDDVTYPDL
jgi:mono/diheme cytochrome c family protein